MNTSALARTVLLAVMIGGVAGCESTDDSEDDEQALNDGAMTPGNPDPSETDTGTEPGGDQPGTGDDSPTGDTDPGGPLSVPGVQVTGLIAAQSAPAGLDDAIVSRIDRVSTNDSGRVVVSAAFTLSDGPGSGVWAGDVTGLASVLTTADSFPGTPNNVRIDTLTGGTVGPDGSIAFVVGFGGAQTNSSLVIQPESSAALTAVASTDQTINGFGAPVTIRSIGEPKPVGQAASVRINPGELLEEGLHLWDGTEMQPIAPLSFNAVFPGAPILESTGCGITVGTLSQQDRHELLSDGRVVFEAQLVNSPTVATCQVSAVMLYDNGSYDPIVVSAEPVPGAPEATFDEVRIHEVLDNGDVVIQARLSSPNAQGAQETFNSFWLYSDIGDAGLTLLEGEEIEVNDSTGRIDASSTPQSLQIDSTGQLAALMRAGDSQIVLAGAARRDQPHASIMAPGASNLTALTSSASDLPAPFPDTSFLSSITDVGTYPDQRVVVGATEENGSTGETVGHYLLLSSPTGQMQRIVSSSDTYLIGGTEQSVQLDRNYDFVSLSTGDIVVKIGDSNAISSVVGVRLRP